MVQGCIYDIHVLHLRFLFFHTFVVYYITIALSALCFLVTLFSLSIHIVYIFYCIILYDVNTFVATCVFRGEYFCSALYFLHGFKSVFAYSQDKAAVERGKVVLTQ